MSKHSKMNLNNIAGVEEISDAAAANVQGGLFVLAFSEPNARGQLLASIPIESQIGEPIKRTIPAGNGSAILFSDEGGPIKVEGLGDTFNANTGEAINFNGPATEVTLTDLGVRIPSYSG